MKRVCLSLLALVLAAALAGCALGPGPEVQPTAAPTAAPQPTAIPTAAPQPTAAPTPLPTEAPAPAELTPAFEEALTEALGWCVAYGPGEAGCSLKEVIGACALLDCAQTYPVSSEAWSEGIGRWLEGLDEETEERFWLNWPGLAATMDAMVTAPEQYLELLEDAGSPNEYDTYEEASRDAPTKAIGEYLPEEREAAA